MDKKEKLLQKRVAGLFALLCVIFFQFFDSDHLFLKEEVVSVASLPEVLVGYWGKPAWLACSMAKVLTSLFVPVGGGAVLITAVLMLEWWASLFILRKFNVGRTKMNIVNMDENIAKSITSTLHKVGGNLNVSEELMKILVISMAFY